MQYPSNITFSGQKVAVCNRYIEQFRLEHNAHPLADAFRLLRIEFDALVPEAYHGHRIKWLKTKWQDVMDGNVELGFPGLELDVRLAATEKKDEAYQALQLFYKYQREESDTTINMLLSERHKAMEECRQDTFHNPTLGDFTIANGRLTLNVPSQNPMNEATNTAFAMRSFETIPDMSAEHRDAVYTAIVEAKKSSYDSTFWDAKIDKELVRTNINIPVPPDPLENFTTWTEVDPVAYQSVSANSITGTAIPRNVSTYVYDDKGAAHFGDFDILIDVQITSAGTLSPALQAVVLSNVVDDYGGIFAASGDALALRFVQAGSDERVQIVETENGSFNQDFDIDYTLNTWRYCRFDSAGSAMRNRVYDDSDRTTLSSTQSVTRAAATTFRYIQTSGSSDFHDAASDIISGICANMDLQEAVAGAPSMLSLLGVGHA